MQDQLQETMRKIRNGDQAAFRELVDGFRQSAFRLSFRILCDEEEARDAVQESFIKIWTARNSVNLEKKITTWIYRIFTNTALDRYRSMKRRNQAPLETVPEMLKNMNDEGFERGMHNRDLAGLIQAVSGRLPEKQRLVFLLRDIEGMESAEVQQILEMNEMSVKSNLYHARKVVREQVLKLLAYERRDK